VEFKSCSIVRNIVLGFMTPCTITDTDTVCHTSYVDCLLARSGWTSLADSQHN